MIKITSRISLEFLGEDYKDSYLIFNSIPIKELNDLQKQAKGVKEENGFEFLQTAVASRFVSGEIAQDGALVSVTEEDLDSLPVSVYTHIFKVLTGVDTDPKA